MSNGYFYQLFRKMGLSEFWAQTGEEFIRGPLSIALIVVLAMFLSRAGSRVVRRSVKALVARSAGKPEAVDTGTGSRAETLAGVAASLVRIGVWTIAFLLVIDKFGINAGPVLAGASIVGVALGFGAQSLVKDFVSGFFMLAEDQFAVGDVITVTDVTGTVEEVNLRMTRLRAADGTVWFVPNGEIRKVGNSCKEWAHAIVDVTIPAGVELSAVTAAIAQEVQPLHEDEAWSDAVLAQPEVLGIEALGTDGYTVRVSAKTTPDARARVARELRARIGRRLRSDGIVPPLEKSSS